MKTIVKLMLVCLTGLAIVSVASCGQKVDKKELDKKIQESMDSDKKTTFTDAEYEFMANYLYDNYDKLYKMDIDDKDENVNITYGFILFDAQLEGKLPPKAVEKYKKIIEKGEKLYNDNEKDLMEASETPEIDWDKAYEELEAIVAEDEAVVVEE